MRLTPPTNATFSLSLLLAVIALVISFRNGFSTSGYLALGAWLVLFVGNMYEKI